MSRTVQGMWTSTWPGMLGKKTPPRALEVQTRPPPAIPLSSHSAFQLRFGQAPTGPCECASIIPPQARERAADVRARPVATNGRPGTSARRTLPNSGLLSARSPPSEKAHSGFTHMVSAQLPAADGGAEPGRSGKSFSPARKPTCGDRHLLLHPDAAVFTHGDVVRPCRELADPPATQLLFSRNHGPRPPQPVLQLGGEVERELFCPVGSFPRFYYSK